MKIMYVPFCIYSSVYSFFKKKGLFIYIRGRGGGGAEIEGERVSEESQAELDLTILRS